MATSGTSNFNLSNAELVFEAFDRCRIRPASITRHHLLSARNSLNLIFRDWDLKNGPNLWKMTSGTIALIQGVSDYNLPANLVTMTEMYFTNVNAGGQGVNIDRFMAPINRTQYAMVSNKMQMGTPTMYWFQYLATPKVTIWSPPFAGSPTYILSWYGVRRIEDANLGGGENPDVLFRGLAAICAELAVALAKKFMDKELLPLLLPDLKADAKEAWENLATIDQEQGPMIIQPNVAVYGKI